LFRQLNQEKSRLKRELRYFKLLHSNKSELAQGSNFFTIHSLTFFTVKIKTEHELYSCGEFGALSVITCYTLLSTTTTVQVDFLTS